ncbi:MAG: M20/M25/M40 family metallo-hydrolase [Ruminococcus sp.]|nr:M20/M25/M40 family metallo-hydrolase [Ruminococcus sp.]
MKNLLKELCLADGISGDEKSVRDIIINKIKDFCDYYTDPLGSLICFRKGRKSSDKKLMICAHMDEVGFIVTAVHSDGTLAFDMVGGVDSSVTIGRQVKVGRNKINGVIGSVAVHNLSKEDREKAPQISRLCIDIGAENKEDAEKHISLGDCVYFGSDFEELGGNKIVSKAVDDRAGCAMMIRLIQEQPEYDTFFVFNVQEEIGLRGSGVTAFAVKPDFALVLEATTASDIDGVSGADKVCSLGGGAVVSFMDRSTMYDKELYKLAFETAKEKNLPCQTKTKIAGGNDAGAIHISGKGVRTLAVSVPCRYLHSPSCTADMEDIENSYQLVKSLSKRIIEL